MIREEKFQKFHEKHNAIKDKLNREKREKEKEAYDYYVEQRHKVENYITEKKENEKKTEEIKFKNFKDYMEEKDSKKRRNLSM